MDDILEVEQKVILDNSIIRYQYHIHDPYVKSIYSNNDEIRISLQNQNNYICLHDSYLYLQLQFLDEKTNQKPKYVDLVNNAVNFLFDSIRYELNGITLDECKDPGIITTLMNYCLLNQNESNVLKKSLWFPKEKINIDHNQGNFDVCIDLKDIFGFSKDFQRILIHGKHEMVLIRSVNDNNCFVYKKVEENKKPDQLKEKPILKINKIQWFVPYVNVAEAEHLKLMKIVDNNKILFLPFRHRSLHIFPLVPVSKKNTWTVKTSTMLEKPRFIIFAFQTKRNNDLSKDNSKFDHCKLSNLKLHLNSESYPYINLNINFDDNYFMNAYNFYTIFQKNYFNNSKFESLLDPITFKNDAPLLIIDCSRQNENIKFGPVDISLEFDTHENIPNDTVAYCLIVHDRIWSYRPLTNEVSKLI